MVTFPVCLTTSQGLPLQTTTNKPQQLLTELIVLILTCHQTETQMCSTNYALQDNPTTISMAAAASSIDDDD